MYFTWRKKLIGHNFCRAQNPIGIDGIDGIGVTDGNGGKYGNGDNASTNLSVCRCSVSTRNQWDLTNVGVSVIIKQTN